MFGHKLFGRLMEEEGEGGGAGGEGGEGAGGDGGEGGGQVSTSWRDAFAVDGNVDPLLERFTQPADLLKSYKEASQKIRSGDLLKPLPDDPSEDDIKAYREQQGIPLEVDGYFAELPEGLVIGEDDKPALEDFAKAMHEINMPPAAVHKAIEWYNKVSQADEDARLELDGEHKGEMESTLREEWGTDYKANMNVAKAMLNSLSGEAQERFKNARMPDGKALFNDPEIVRWLVAQGREINPAATLTTVGDGSDQSIDKRITEIEATMGTPAYTKNANVQKELLKLYEIRENRKSAA